MNLSSKPLSKSSLVEYFAINQKAVNLYIDEVVSAAYWTVRVGLTRKVENQGCVLCVLTILGPIGWLPCATIA